MLSLYVVASMFLNVLQSYRDEYMYKHMGENTEYNI